MNSVSKSTAKILVNALNLLPEKKLIKGDLHLDGCYCALGAVARAHKIKLSSEDPDDVYEKITDTTGISKRQKI